MTAPSLLQALEALALGITGKRLLWRSLGAIAPNFAAAARNRFRPSSKNGRRINLSAWKICGWKWRGKRFVRSRANAKTADLFRVAHASACWRASAIADFRKTFRRDCRITRETRALPRQEFCMFREFGGSFAVHESSYCTHSCAHDFTGCANTSARVSSGKHPFTFEDMMKLKRVGAPVPSPDGKWVVFDAEDVDLEANTKNLASMDRAGERWRIAPAQPDSEP